MPIPDQPSPVAASSGLGGSDTPPDVAERYQRAVDQFGAVLYQRERVPGGEDRYVFVSARIADLTGFSSAEFTPQRWSDVIQESIDLPPETTATQTGRPREVRRDYRIRTKSGQERWIHDAFIRLYDAHGELTGWLGILHDVTEPRRVARALRDSEAQYRMLFANHPHPMWVYDSETLRFLAVNEAAVAHYGYSRDTFLGFTLKDIRPPEDVPALLANLARNETHTHDAGVWRHRKNDGTLIAVEITGHPCIWEGRACEMIIAQDVTARLRAEAALRASEARFRALTEHGSDLIFLVDPDTFVVRFISRSVERILGWSPSELEGRDNASLFHPDDVPQVADTLARAIADKERTASSPHRVRFRYRHKDGSWRWLDAVGANQMNDPDLRGIVVNARDVTDAVRANEQTSAILRTALDGFWMTDWDGHILEVNDAYCRLTGFERAELLARRVENIELPEWRAQTTQERQTVVETGSHRFETRHRCKNGRILDLEVSVNYLPAEDAPQSGSPGGRFFTFFRDITARKSEAERVWRQAYHDVLTGLPNRALFTDRLERALAQAERRGEPLAVLFLDLDHFKIVNDTHGHAAGDRLLQEAAARLARVLRAEDTLARLGGDEFTVLLPHLPTSRGGAGRAAVRVARKILAALKKPFPLDKKDGSAPAEAFLITTSVGISLFPQNGTDAPALLRHADAAMYRAKQQGRDGFHLFTPPEQPELF